MKSCFATLLAGALALSLLTTGYPAYSQEKETAALPQQAVDYILDLQSDDYQARQKATQELPKFGEQVVPPLLKVTQGDSLEAAVRAILVIEQVYILGKANSVGPAEDALEKLTKAKNPSVAIRAEEAIDRHADIREKRAVREIKKMGGTVKLWTPEDIARTAPGGSVEPGQVRYVALGSKWTGGEDGLRFIKRVRKFPVLYLIKGHPLPDLALEDLMRALPATQFQTRDSDAMLGITHMTGIRDQGGCLVGEVSDGLAAQKAGIRSGDFILKFDDKPVENFDALVKLIGGKSAGDVVQVELLRDGMIKKLPVTLSSWLDR